MNHTITRRHLAKGTAWAMPAVAMGAAAPQAAASTTLGILGSSNVSYGDYYRSTQPLVTDLGGASFTTNPAGATATFTNVTVWYYLPWSNATFRRYSGGDTRWSLLARDSSVANITSPTTGNTYYAYKTTFAGPIKTSSGPSYAFQATSALPVSSRFTGGYYYHIEGTVDGVKDTSRPYRPVTPTGCSPACSAP